MGPAHGRYPVRFGPPRIADGAPAGAPVDVVFTSEHYGAELASRLGAKHVQVDLDRVRFPVSGTAVRADPVGQWRFLAPATRAGLATRIVVVGAESTGTTTLSRALAEHYGAPWVPEHGRLHTEEKLAAAIALTGPDATPESLVWTLGDFIDVADRQAAAEDAAATGPVLVCDNDPWAATIWGERYLGREHPEMAAVGDRKPALYPLTDHAGVPFEQDGRRDGEHPREWMTERFVRGLRARGVPWELVTGDREDRLAQAIRACDAAISERFTFADPL